MSDSDSVPGSDSDEQRSGDEARFGNASKEMFARKKIPPPAILSQINNTKTQIATLLKIHPNDPNLDSVIATKLVENEIDTTQTQLNQLTALLTQLQKEKKGGKKHKSKKYRKSRKQRKTKTKRRLRRSYKYK